MYVEILSEAGLSLNESKIYETMLSLGESSVQTISLKAKIHRRNVYDSISKLIEKGLISEVFIKGEKRFKAMSPTKLLDLIKEKEAIIASAIPEMTAKFEFTQEKEEAYIYKGIEGVKSYLNDILKVGKDVCFIGAKAMWLDPRLKHFLLKFEKEAKKKGIKFRHIFDYEVKEEIPEILKLVGKPYKFFPKKYSSHTMIDIFGDYVVTFISGEKPGLLPDEPIQFVMKSKSLADGYRKFFEFMWDNFPDEK